MSQSTINAIASSVSMEELKSTNFQKDSEFGTLSVEELRAIKMLDYDAALNFINSHCDRKIAALTSARNP